MAKRKKPEKHERRERGSGYITPLARGRAKAHYPNPAGGYFVKRCRDTQEAEEWLAELGQRAAADQDLTGGQQTLTTWLEHWIGLLRTDPENPLKEKTLFDYRFKLGYVGDLLGKMVLSEIKPDHADDAIRKIRKALAQTTASQIHNLFWRVMEEAFERSYIPRNPVRRPRRRAKRRRSDTRRRSVYHLNPREGAALIHQMHERREGLAWWLLLLLGLREGEVLGLRRCDLDLKNATITVVQQYTQIDGKAHHSTTKTDYADRVLPIPRALVPAFEALLGDLTHRAALATRRGTWQEHSLLFPGKSGRPMVPTSFYHMLKRALPDAGLPERVTVHHLRHSAAKYYTDLGAPDAVRVAIAGHSPRTITDYYGPPDVETLRPWVERVYNLLIREMGQQQQRREEAG
jgi:integrase